MLNEKGFNAALKRIKINADTLAQAIHDAGIFAIAQANEHGNIGFGTRLVEAMGKKHDAQRVVTWLCHFGKFGVKGGELVYRARKDIGPDKIEATIAAAEATPYWELTKQKELTYKVDYLALLNSLLNRHEKAEELRAEGREVDESNITVLDEVRELIARHQAAAAKAVEGKPEHRVAVNDTIVLDGGIPTGC